jgi:hypothetical protein
LTKVNEAKDNDGAIVLRIALDDEDIRLMDTRDSGGYFQAVEISPQKGTTFAKVAFVLKPSGVPGKPPIPQQVIIPIKSILIGKLHAKDLRALKEAEKKQAELEKMNEADRKRAEKMKTLSPCCEAKMLHDDKDPADIVTCTKCEEKYRKIGTSWIHADIEPPGGK